MSSKYCIILQKNTRIPNNTSELIEKAKKTNAEISLHENEIFGLK